MGKHKARFIYSFNINSRKMFLIFFTIIFTIAFTFSYKYIEKNLAPVIKTLALSKANTLALELINDTVTEVTSGKIEYFDICSANKSQDGKIESIVSNTSKINEVKIAITDAIIKKVNTEERFLVYIPLGSITGSNLLSGSGPMIPASVLITGSPNISFDNKFESAGINQTKHTINIVTYVEFDVVLPFATERTSITADTILCETIIIGDIPEVYISR